MKNNTRIESVLKRQLSEISLILERSYKHNENLGVLSGISGACLFQFYYAKYLNDSSKAQIATNIIKEAINRINDGYDFPSYCKGLGGFGWLIEHLVHEEFIEINTDDLLSDLDEYLYKVMILNTKEGYYDFLHGGIGYGMYFLKRFQNTKSNILRKRYQQYLRDLIFCLKKTSEKDNDSVKWTSKFNYETNELGYNLGLSHGISSIINFLSRLCFYAEFRIHAEPLVRGAILYVLKFENQEEYPFSLFPSWILNSSGSTNSRLAWCYGDLGIGLSLMIASKALNDDFLYQKSLQIFRYSIQRKTSEQTMVKDASFCHGSFGNAQIFNRVYKETKEDIFRKTAQYWINQGILMTNKIEIPEIQDKHYKSLPDWKKEVNFLTGIPGIGMAILFHLSDFEAKWDECLMLV